jgi:putative membrane protein (TIGR04086 family)
LRQLKKDVRGCGLKIRKRFSDGGTKPHGMTMAWLAIVVMAAVSGLMLLILAAVLYYLEPGEAFIRIGVIFTYVISTIAGGILLGKLSQRRRLLYGLLAGTIYFLVLFILSVAIKQSFEMETAKMLSTFAICAGSGMAGAMIS